MLILVVGPSGAGKDSLLNGARARLAGDPRFHFVRRVITRPADPDGEDHEPATEVEFLRRDFALSWSAHGLRYGIPAEALSAAPVVIANVSRGVIADAAARHPVRVIEVTAPPEVLAARLAARGREQAADIARRLERRMEIPAGVVRDTVVNDGSLEEGIAPFVGALMAALPDRE
jgi:phosphonate metabolism protein PhnN/1,5-bisphosphokinase (PRPP-forming)